MLFLGGTALHQVVNCLRVVRCVMSIIVLEPGGNASARDFQVHRFCKKWQDSPRDFDPHEKHVEAYHVSVFFFIFGYVWNFEKLYIVSLRIQLRICR